MQPETFVFFGIVGSGKGTQAKLLMDRLKEKGGDTLYIYPGNEFRKMLAEPGYTNGLVKEIYDRGALQPLFLTTWVFSDMLVKQFGPGKHLLVDAFPRDLDQARAFESAMEFYARTNIHIVYIKVSKEEAVRRMKLRGRSDDSDAGIEQRFREYENKVVPSMEYLRSKPGYTLHEINGEQSVEAVYGDIIKALGL